MIRRLQESIKIRTKNTLNLLGGNGHLPQHFVILSAPRVGSTLLHTYLNSHWNLLSHGEFLGRALREGQTPDIGRFYQQPTARFITHTGCKVFYEYTRNPGLKDALNKLYSDPQLYIIHLTREDAIASYMSLLKARATAEWSGSRTESPAATMVDTEHMLKYLRDLAADQNDIPRLFESEKILQLKYEALVDNPERELDHLQRFLGVKQRRLQSVLQQQRSTDQWGEHIQNYDEVRQALENTPWQSLLAESYSE